jgi:hypothetical protein
MGLSLFLTLLLMGLVYGIFRYGTPDIPDSAWKKFAPPEGKCSIEFPGEPEAEDIPAEGFAVQSGKRFIVKRWYERVELAFGWIDLDADMAMEKHFDSMVFDLLRREMKRLNGRLSGEQTLSFVTGGRKWEARRYQGDTDTGKAVVQIYFDADPKRIGAKEVIQKEPRRTVEFVPTGFAGLVYPLPVDGYEEVRKTIFPPGQRLRLYFAEARGKKLKADTPLVDRFFNSFSPN